MTHSRSLPRAIGCAALIASIPFTGATFAGTPDICVAALESMIPSDEFREVEIDGTTAYLLSRSGMTSYDVSDPSNPVMLDSYTTSSISTFILDGTHIYGLSISQDLTILDISDPSDITELAVYEIPFPFMSFPLVFAESVVRRGDNLIVSASEPFQTGMIGIVDISTPTAPVLTDSFDFLADGVFSNGVMVAAGDYAYIRTSMYSTTGPTPPATVGIGVYNISDPTDITFVRHIPVSGIIESLTVEGGYLYSAPDFIAFDLTDPADPLPLGTLSPGAGSYIDFDGNRAIYGRNIVSLTTPTNPEVITSLHSLQGLTVDARLRGDLVYAVTNEGFMILDLNDCDLVCAADYDGNTVTDFFDLSLFLVDFYAMDPNADLNDDMVFDFFDLSTFLDYFGVGCP